MSIVIQITNLSKIYRPGEIGTGTISRDLERWKIKVKKRKKEKVESTPEGKGKREK